MVGILFSMNNITNDQLTAFKTKGYLVLRGFYSPKTMVQLSNALDRIEQDDKDPGYKYYDGHVSNSKESVLTRIEKFLFNHDDVDAMIWTPGLQQVLTQLLGDKPAIFKDKINFKLSGGKPDLLHQDQAAGWGTYADYFISAAIFVDANTKANAAMSVLKTGDYPRQLMGEEWALLANPEPPFKPESDYELLEGDPGDIVFFDSFVPHGSPANTSNARRRNIFITVNRASVGDFRNEYYADKLKNYPPNNKRDPNKQYTYRV